MRLARPTSFFALTALAAVVSLAPATFAQSDADRATARQLGQEGFAALDSKDFKTAEDRLKRADQLVHAPTLLLGLARAQAGMRKFVHAQETYQRIIREGVAPGAPEAFKAAIESAKQEVGSILPFIGGVTIEVTAAGVAPGTDLPNLKVTVDEVPINAASLGVRRTIDPGEHVLVATADGYKRAETHFTVPEGGSTDAPVTMEKDPNWVAPTTAPSATTAPTGILTPPPPTGTATIEQPVGPPPSRSVLPWVVMGAGGVILVAGAVSGIVAIGDHSSLATPCKGGTCPQSESGELSSYHTVAGISTGGFIVGGVGIAAGVVLLLMQPKASIGVTATPAAGLHVTPVIGPGSLGAVGTF
jgi:hypothetical protein